MKQIHEGIKVDIVSGTLIKNGIAAACGFCTIERGYAGLFNVVVGEQWRGMGFGREICRSLLSAANNEGAHTAYLQVIKENHIAVGMYEKLDFKALYSYWYRGIRKG